MYMQSISEQHNERIDLTLPIVQVRDRMIHWRPGTFNVRISPVSGLPPCSVVPVSTSPVTGLDRSHPVRVSDPAALSPGFLPAYSIRPAHMPEDVPCLLSWVLYWLFDKECGLN